MQNNNQIKDQSGNSYNHLLQDGFIVAWWSAGITSAVACKMALEMYENVELYYIDINSAHSDNPRFKADCEKWYGKEIKPLSSKEFKNQFDVIEKTYAEVLVSLNWWLFTDPKKYFFDLK